MSSPIKLVIFGGRDFIDTEGMRHTLFEAVNAGFITEDLILLCGMARGADMTAYKLFKSLNLPVQEYPADWDNLGRGAGFVRNREMAIECTKGIGFWDGKSAGTKHMIGVMQSLQKPLLTIRY